MKLPLLALGLMATASQAVVTSLTPAAINNGSTATTSYSDANVTLTPFIGSTAATFNANALRLGIDDQTGTGTNVNAFNDPDLIANNGNEEGLQFEFQPTVGLSQIGYDFSRADGTDTVNFNNNGVIISGFSTDPTITFVSLEPVPVALPAGLFYVWDSGSGSVRINIPAGGFNGNDVGINFDPDASRGATLFLKAMDTEQASGQAQTGGQFAVIGISYDVVPEPSAAVLGCLSLLGLLRRRR